MHLQASALLKEDGFPTGITSRYPLEDIQRIKQGFHHGLMLPPTGTSGIRSQLETSGGAYRIVYKYI
jgi:hypothetical protein